MAPLRLHERLVVKVGDLTREPADAIVNAANASLLGGGGVDGAIHRAGGPAILAECREIRRTRFPGAVPVGEAVITTGGNLPARHVIHTVGPVYGHHAGDEPRLLAACYANSAALAASHGIATLAFPAISTGAFGYPRAEAAAVVGRTVAAALERHPELAEIRLVFFAPEDARVFIEHQMVFRAP